MEVGQVELQPFESSRGHQDRVILPVAQFLNAGRNVAAKIFEDQVGAKCEQLRLSACAAEVPTRACFRNENFLRLSTASFRINKRSDGSSRPETAAMIRPAGCSVGRSQRMHGKVGLTVQQCFFDLFGEKPLPSSLSKLGCWMRSPWSLDDLQLTVETDILQQGLNESSLPEREFASRVPMIKGLRIIGNSGQTGDKDNRACEYTAVPLLTVCSGISLAMTIGTLMYFFQGSRSPCPILPVNARRGLRCLWQNIGYRFLTDLADLVGYFPHPDLQ